MLPEEKLYRLAVLRDTASALADFVISLRPVQLEEFWLPYTAHLLVYATTILLRCVAMMYELPESQGLPLGVRACVLRQVESYAGEHINTTPLRR